MRGQLWSRASRPIQNEALRRKVRSLLAEEGFRMEDLVIMTRPPAWKYAHVLLPGSGELRRVVVFADTAAKLTEDELLAVIASQAARIKFHHGPWRIALSAAGGFITCAVLGWAANTRQAPPRLHQYAYALALLFGFALRSPARCHARCASFKVHACAQTRAPPCRSVASAPNGALSGASHYTSAAPRTHVL